MSCFKSAEAATAALTSLQGIPPELVRLIELHGGEYRPDQGLADVRAETQRLWVPRRGDGTIIKVPDLDVPTLDRQYADAVRQESWHILDALGATDGFAPLSDEYGIVLAHGTSSDYAQANFNRLVELANHGLKFGDEIIILSAPYMMRKPDAVGLDQVNAVLVPPPWKWDPPITEAVSMSWLWEHTPKPAALENLRVTAISCSDARTAHGPYYIPDTLDSLVAMHQCRFDSSVVWDECAGHKIFVGESFPSANPVLNLAGTRRQLLRQHVVTRDFLGRRGINCQIYTVNASTDEPQWLVLSLIEVAKLIWALCDELGIAAN